MEHYRTHVYPLLSFKGQLILAGFTPFRKNIFKTFFENTVYFSIFIGLLFHNAFLSRHTGFEPV
jgi:hypothetical protein